MSIDSRTIEDVVRGYSAGFCAQPLAGRSRAFPRYEARLVRCLSHHAAELHREGRGGDDLLGHVRAYPAPGDPEGRAAADLLEEVVLAQACLEREAKARGAFLLRFQAAVEDAARGRLGRVGGREFDQEVGDLWSLFAEPRPRSRPRLDEYWGRTPLWSFVWLCLTRCYLDWRRRVLAEPRPAVEEPRAGESALDLQVREECAARLAEAFASAAGELSAEDRLLVWWVDCENRSQSALAKVLGVSEGHLSRKHTRALARLRELATSYLDERYGAAAREEYLQEFATAHEQVRTRLAAAVVHWSKSVGDEAPATLRLRTS